MIDCCCLSAYDAEPPRYCRERTVVARKRHKCCECGKLVVVGEQHRYVFLIDCDGGVAIFRTCETCCTVRDQHDCGDGYIFGQLWENLTKCYGREIISGDFSGDNPDDPCTHPFGPPANCRFAGSYSQHDWKLISEGTYRCSICKRNWNSTRGTALE